MKDKDQGRWQDDARVETPKAFTPGSLDDALQRMEKLAAEARDHRGRWEVWAAGQPQTKTCAKHSNRVLRVDDDRSSAESWAEMQRIGDDAFVMRYGRCPECEIEGKVASESHWLRTAGVPDNLIHGAFVTFRIERPEDEKNLAEAKAFAAKGRGFLMMTGNVGDGKSLLAVAVLREFLGGRFVTHNNLLIELRRGYGDRNAEDVILKCQQTKCLVIDDFGLSMGGGDELPMLQSILDHRYGNKLPTIITANLTLQQIHDFIGERLADRVRQATYRHLQFTGPSSRKAERESYFS